MRGCFSATARAIAQASLAAFILFTGLVLMLFNLNRLVFNAEAFKRTLAEQQVYARLPALVAEQLDGQGDALQGNLFAALDSGDWQLVFDELLTPEWVQTQGESVIDQLFTYLRSEAQQPQLVISLVELKERMRGETGQQALVQVFREKTPCTMDEIVSITLLALSNVDPANIPLCRPPNELLDSLAPVLGLLSTSAASTLPDQIDLAEPYRGVFPGLQTAYRAARLAGTFGLMLPLVLLMLITIFAVRSERDLLIWWGWPFVGAGAVLLLYGLALQPIFRFLLGQAARPQAGRGLAPASYEIVLDLGNMLLSSVTTWSLVEAGVLFGVGLLLLGTALFTRRKPALGEPAG